MTYVPQVLTLDSVKEGARKGVVGGYIGFLKGMTYCSYFDGESGGKCAIGCAMSEEAVSHARKKGTLGGAVNDLLQHDVVFIPLHEQRAITDLQSDHDNIALTLRRLSWGMSEDLVLDAIYAAEEQLIRFLCKLGWDLDVSIWMTGSLLPEAVAIYSKES